MNYEYLQFFWISWTNRRFHVQSNGNIIFYLQISILRNYFWKLKDIYIVELNSSKNDTTIISNLFLKIGNIVHKFSSICLSLKINVLKS
jgi:hypothetical protein